MIKVGPTFVKVFSSLNLFFKLYNKSTSFISLVDTISSTLIVSPLIIGNVSIKLFSESSLNITFLVSLFIFFTFF